MRTMAALIALALIAPTASAAPGDRRKPRVQPVQAPAPMPRDAARSYVGDAYDPSGNYRAYPDWARRALSPRGGGQGR